MRTLHHASPQTSPSRNSLSHGLASSRTAPPRTISRTGLPYRGPSHSRAFSTILVISSMLFLSMAVMAMTALFAHEAHRTRAALAETQLRQLLLAAVPAAQEQLAQARLRAANPPAELPIPVPVEGATLTLHFAGNTVTAEARLRGFKASQTLLFENGQLISATLTQTAGQ